MKHNVFHNEKAVKKLIHFIRADGPEVHEYEEMTTVWNSLVLDTASCCVNGLSTERLATLFGEEFLYQTSQGFGYRKPHGYAGDFEIIDSIYQQKISADARFQKWDKYFHSTEACKAVRNRKDYFVQLVKDTYRIVSKPIRILNLASGPCRDVSELFEQVPSEKINMHCVDIDPKAIEYAKNVLGRFSNNVQFTRANIFKFDTSEKFDLVWSAGLFDYFNDDHFVKVLSKVYSWSSANSEIVIGNFSICNPNRAYMEKAAQWYLFHRSEDELKALASKVVSSKDQLEIKSESLGVNLFLHIKRSCAGVCTNCIR